MKVQVKQFGFNATISKRSDDRYQLTVLVNRSIAGERPAPMIMSSRYRSFLDAHHELYRILGLIAQERLHG